MEIKVIKVGKSKHHNIYKVLGSGKLRGYSETVTKADNSIGAINSMLNSDYSTIKLGDYFKAPADLSNDVSKYWNIKYAFTYRNGIWKYYNSMQACKGD